jgi:Zn-finger protein
MKQEFFSHIECEAYPCHDINEEEEFNCIFCFCPFYTLDELCEGNYIRTEKGIKDCSACTAPHKRSNYKNIIKKLTLP